MIKGGYKVIVFEGYTLTDTPVIIPGIFNTIQNNYEKMLLCSGVSSADYLYDDNVGFCTIGDDGDFEIQFGNQKIKVSEDDEVTMTPSGGGGGGVSDYNDLTSKPKINNITLTGNKSASDLGIQIAEQGKGLSTNDFTDTLKSKLDGIETGAEVNVQPDWEQDDSSADDYIKNKPTIPEVKDDLSDLDDVNIFNPQDGQALIYDSESEKWKNKNVQGGGGGTWGSITGDISDQTDLQNALNNKVNKVAVTEAWNSTKTYSVGEYCINNNSIWKCLVQNSGQTPAEDTYWTLVTIMGEVGELNTNLVANSTQFVFDYHDGKYGYNTDTERGADTFHPFSQGSNPTVFARQQRNGNGPHTVNIAVTKGKYLAVFGGSVLNGNVTLTLTCNVAGTEETVLLSGQQSGGGGTGFCFVKIFDVPLNGNITAYSNVSSRATFEFAVFTM